MSKAGIKSLGFKSLIVTQFLGALNDNAFKFLIAVIIVDTIDQSSGGTLYLALCGAVFILPFLLFSMFAGFLADRFSKKHIIVVTKVMEVVIMMLGLWALIDGSMVAILTVLFVMGFQSALFSPSKYGILPEILEKKKISEGNGVIQMWTYIAILVGQTSAGFLGEWTAPDYYLSSYLFIGIAVVGMITSFSVTRVPIANRERKLEFNFVKEVYHNLKWIRQDRALFLSIMGLMYFGFLGGLFQPNVLLYARKVMEIDLIQTGFLVASLTMGIGLGCILAGKFSLDKVELGLVPLGAVGLSTFSIILGFVHYSYPLAMIIIFLLGISSGFFMIPLSALVQTNSPPDRLGQVIATNNILSFIGILIGSLCIYVLRDLLHLNAAHIFVVIGVMTIVGTIYIIRLLPYAFVRFIVWILAHSIYKIKVVDRQHVPAKGGALLACNHVSYIDAVLLVVTIQRPIRFLMYRNIYEIKWLKPIFKLAGAIPISYTDGPKQILKSLNTATEAIQNGELVCIFPEGQLTRTGNMLRFNKGLERIIRHTDCPIIPVHLDRVWGSIFSYERGKYFYKSPRALPYPVTVNYGEALPSDASTFTVRNHIRELGANSFPHRLDQSLTLPENFWKQARKHPKRLCIGDSSGRQLTYRETLISAVILKDKLEDPLKDQTEVGICLPPSVGGVLSNLAVSMSGRVPVNLNYTTSAEALDSIIEQCQMSTVISSRLFMEKLNLKIGCEVIYIEDILKTITSRDKFTGFLTAVVCPGFIAQRMVFGRSKDRDLNRLATIMFTSGSTGQPKGVKLTHANIMSNLEGLYQIFHVQKTDVMMGVLPFFHSFGFTGTMWFPLVTGAGAVYHVNPLDAKMVGRLTQQHRATILMATPTFLNTYIRRCTEEQFDSLRLVVVGAEKLKSSISQAFEEKFGIEPMEGYGCTELSPIVSINLPDYRQEGVRQKSQKRGKIGLPLPGIAVRILNPETYEPVDVNEDGLMQVKGPNVMQGYLGRDDLTHEVIQDGWYSTGDVANIDEEGFIMITDRLSRFSKIAGEMVPHIKVEETIHAVCNASDPMCVVTSVPDDKKGERLVVLYAADFDPVAVVQQLKSTDLPNLWVPDAKMFFKIESIPLLGTGKTDLSRIKQLARQYTEPQCQRD